MTGIGVLYYKAGSRCVTKVFLVSKTFNMIVS